MQFVNMLFPCLPKSILERKAEKRKRKERKAKQLTKRGKGKGQVMQFVNVLFPRNLKAY